MMADTDDALRALAELAGVVLPEDDMAFLVEQLEVSSVLVRPLLELDPQRWSGALRFNPSWEP
jgi:hypothetical protein